MADVAGVPGVAPPALLVMLVLAEAGLRRAASPIVASASAAYSAPLGASHVFKAACWRATVAVSPRAIGPLSAASAPSLSTLSSVSRASGAAS